MVSRNIDSDERNLMSENVSDNVEPAAGSVHRSEEQPADGVAADSSPRAAGIRPLEIGADTAPGHPSEIVGRGLLFSLGGIVAGVVLTGLIWKVGFVASIAGYLMAMACVKLYEFGAGGLPRRGAFPLIGVTVVGALLCMLAVVGIDANQYYSENVAGSFDAVSRSAFIRSATTDPTVLKAYLSTFAMMALFTALGIFSTLRNIMRNAATA